MTAAVWITATVLLVVAVWLVQRRMTPKEVVVDPILARARVLTAEQDERWGDRDGEAKRHQVYSRLIKEFPDRQKRELARAIEDALHHGDTT